MNQGAKAVNFEETGKKVNNLKKSMDRASVEDAFPKSGINRILAVHGQPLRMEIFRGAFFYTKPVNQRTQLCKRISITSAIPSRNWR